MELVLSDMYRENRVGFGLCLVQTMVIFSGQCDVGVAPDIRFRFPPDTLHQNHNPVGSQPFGIPPFGVYGDKVRDTFRFNSGVAYNGISGAGGP